MPTLPSSARAYGTPLKSNVRPHESPHFRMATNKTQHFVPRVHLKAFATADSSDAINLYNVDRDRVVLGAATKHQCSGDYFYGRDQALDDAIQMVEREYGRVVLGLLTPQSSLSDEDHISLIIFWHLQYLRTEAASRRSSNRSTCCAFSSPAGKSRCSRPPLPPRAWTRRRISRAPRS